MYIPFGEMAGKVIPVENAIGIGEVFCIGGAKRPGCGNGVQGEMLDSMKKNFFLQFLDDMY